jgi:hypothetical protein
MRFIHELTDWPNFKWTVPAVLIGQVRYQQGRLLGRMENLGLKWDKPNQ